MVLGIARQDFHDLGGNKAEWCRRHRFFLLIEGLIGDLVAIKTVGFDQSAIHQVKQRLRGPARILQKTTPLIGSAVHFRCRDKLVGPVL